jgi:hypothetical protein
MKLSPDPSLYTDDEARLMGLAFNAAWDYLVAVGSVHAQASRAEHTRELLALKVIELLRRGAPDVRRLCDEALSELEFMLARGQDAGAGQTAQAAGAGLARQPNNATS